MSAAAQGLGPSYALVSGREQGAGKVIQQTELVPALMCMLKLQAEA